MEKQKSNAKQARQQRREAFEARQRLKDIKREIYKKKIDEKIIEKLHENKQMLLREGKEFEKWRGTIEICESGREFDYEEFEHEYTDLIDFINAVVVRKITDINELSLEFQVKVEDIISRISQLEDQNIINGLLTEKGQYISINESEWEYIYNEIERYGKVTKSRDLVSICNDALEIPKTLNN